MDRKKKLEILYVDDIISMNNNIFSQNTNHYLRKLLYDLRILFRSNGENLDEFIDLYYYIVDLLNNEVELNNDELKIFIYQLVDLSLNIDDYHLFDDTIILESTSYLIQALYQELEAFKLADKLRDDENLEQVLLNQLKNQDVIFNKLIDIKNNSDDEKVVEILEQLLNNNYYNEYTTYKARIEHLDVV